MESPEVEFLEDAAALTDGEEDDGEETEDLGSGVQKKPAAGKVTRDRLKSHQCAQAKKQGKIPEAYVRSFDKA